METMNHVSQAELVAADQDSTHAAPASWVKPEVLKIDLESAQAS